MESTSWVSREWGENGMYLASLIGLINLFIVKDWGANEAKYTKQLFCFFNIRFDSPHFLQDYYIGSFVEKVFSVIHLFSVYFFKLHKYR